MPDARDICIGRDPHSKAMMPEFDVRGEIRFFELEQVALAPLTSASPIAIFIARALRDAAVQ